MTSGDKVVALESTLFDSREKQEEIIAGFVDDLWFASSMNFLPKFKANHVKEPMERLRRYANMCVLEVTLCKLVEDNDLLKITKVNVNVLH